MLVLALSLLLSPVFGIPEIPENITEPRFRYECELVDEAFRKLKLRFRDEGGRGYWGPGRVAATTPRKIFFEEDGTNLLHKMRERERQGRKVIFESEEGWAYVEEVMPTAFSDEAYPASLVIVFERGNTLQRMVGFCDVRVTKQKPLSQAESSAFLRQSQPK